MNRWRQYPYRERKQKELRAWYIASECDSGANFNEFSLVFGNIKHFQGEFMAIENTEKIEKERSATRERVRRYRARQKAVTLTITPIKTVTSKPDEVETRLMWIQGRWIRIPI